MEVLEAITSRRSVFKFKPDHVPTDVIERVFGRRAHVHDLVKFLQL